MDESRRHGQVLMRTIAKNERGNDDEHNMLLASKKKAKAACATQAMT
jgi:hypothetical protein